MKLKTGTILAPYYNVIDKNTNKKLDRVIFADDKHGVFTSYDYHPGFKNIGISISPMDYIEFRQIGNIKLVGKNFVFEIVRVLINKFTK
jgi:hypothetical protein